MGDVKAKCDCGSYPDGICPHPVRCGHENQPLDWSLSSSPEPASGSLLEALQCAARRFGSEPQGELFAQMAAELERAGLSGLSLWLDTL